MPALNILRRNGYKLYIQPDSRDEYYGDFWAIKEKRDFIADNPVALLGLVRIWEEFGDGEGWQPQNSNYEDVQEELAEIAFPDEPYPEISDDDFAGIVDYWQDFFEAVGAEFEKPVTKQQLYDFFNK